MKRAKVPAEVAAEVKAAMPEAPDEQLAAETARRIESLKQAGLLIEQWDLDEIGADLNRCGLAGSPTKVHRVQAIVLTKEGYTEVPPTEAGVRQLDPRTGRGSYLGMRGFRVQGQGSAFGPPALHAPTRAPDPRTSTLNPEPCTLMLEPNRQGEVWVFAEQEDGSLHDVVLELCGKARELADRLGVRTGAVLPGAGVGPLAKRLIAHGINNVYLADHPRLSHYQTLPYARVLGSLVEKHRPQIVIVGATAIGRDLAPRVASSLRSGLTADCTDLDIADVTDPKAQVEHKNLLLQIRPAFGGNIIATIVNYDQWPQMATVREGVMPMQPAANGRTGRVIEEKVEIDERLDGPETDPTPYPAAQGQPQGRAGDRLRRRRRRQQGKLQADLRPGRGDRRRRRRQPRGRR